MSKQGKDDFVINVGDPRSDGIFLCYGFEPARHWEGALGGNCRWAKEKSLLKVPVNRDADNKVTLVVKGPSSGHIRPGEKIVQNVSVRIKDREVKTFTIVAGDWHNVEFTIPKEQCKDGLVRLQLICEQFCEDGAFGGALCLAQVRIANVSYSHERPSYDDLSKMNVYFGDPHKHSTISPCGRPSTLLPDRYAGTPEENYENYAKDMDFCCITDHAETMSEQVFRELLDIADRYYNPGEFVSFYGYEWTSNLFGHRNVYTTDKNIPLCRCNSSAYDTPQKLWNALRGYNAITIPHHATRVEFPGYWDIINDEMQPLVEIYSGWGDSEYFGSKRAETVNTAPGFDVQSALLKGHKLGFVGGSDGHLIKNKNISSGYLTPFDGRSWGLTGVCADSLTREAIFEALKKRRVYATTGARIFLKFQMNDCPMGTEIFFNQYNADLLFPLAFAIDIKGTDNIAKIELICNNQVIRTATDVLTNEFKAGFVVEPRYSTDRVAVIKTAQPVSLTSFTNCFSMYFYVRVTQIDGHVAWSSPIWLTFHPECA